MTVLGYSKLVELLTGKNEYAFEGHMMVLVRHGLSHLRFSAFHALAIAERSTINGLLANIDAHQGGGTYRSVEEFFDRLAEEGILEKCAVGRRTYWQFSQKHKTFATYIASLNATSFS